MQALLDDEGRAFLTMQWGPTQSCPSNALSRPARGRRGQQLLPLILSESSLPAFLHPSILILLLKSASQKRRPTSHSVYTALLAAGRPPWQPKSPSTAATRSSVVQALGHSMVAACGLVLARQRFHDAQLQHRRR